MEWTVIQVVKGLIETPEPDDPGYEQYLLDMAAALRAGAQKAAEMLEEEVMFLRFLRGDCPRCGAKLEGILGWAREWRKIIGYECPSCGVRYARKA
ncbi:MAG: hypothetical protein KM310_06885 [Clostridiales bacterium]|nr:hypothetical protein [Clostridiales bacterium]